MKLKALFADDDAVSPVIGVILMVAITVILAAVIGTFVLGLGDQVGNNAPQASFSFDFDDGASSDELTVTHNGGGKIEAARLSVKSDSSVMADEAGGSPPVSSNAWSDYSGATTDVTAGDSITVTAASGEELNSATIRVIWTSDSGDSSAELGTWSGPDA